MSAALLAMRMMAQDTGGGGAGGAGAGGAAGGAGAGGGGDMGTGLPDNSGGNGPTGPDSLEGDQGQGGNGAQGQQGNGAESQQGNGQEGQQGNGNQGQDINGIQSLEGNGETGLSGSGSETLPMQPGGDEGTGTLPSLLPTLPSVLPPGFGAPIPGTTPFPTPAPPGSAYGGTQGAVKTAPVTFNLPGGYGGSSGQSFTLGAGRLAKPPVTFTATVSQGFDTNIFNADAHPGPTPKASPTPTPPIQERLVGFRVTVPLPPVPIFQIIKPSTKPTPVPGTVGVIRSPVSTLTLGAQTQIGTPRTVFTSDLSVGLQDYWNQPGSKTDYNGSFDLAMAHRISPRATLSVEADMVYQNTPNFALINAPTNNNNGSSYLNGDIKADLTYNWSGRLSTVTSYSISFNILDSVATQNVYGITYGNQFRYTVSARDTLTAEVRGTETVYPSNSSGDNNAFFYLVGLDTFISSKLRNTLDGGLEVESYSGGGSQEYPYVESATTLAIVRGGSLSWTNRYGSEDTGSSAATAKSYRTGLSITEPLSTKLVASLSTAYVYYLETALSKAATGYTQNQFQMTLSLGYTVSPRLSFSLSYTYIDFLTTQLNSSYKRQQIYLGGTYTFE